MITQQLIIIGFTFLSSSFSAGVFYNNDSTKRIPDSAFNVSMRCSSGYKKQEHNNKCKACADGWFGRDCLKRCNCFEMNTLDSVCDKKTGMCTCKPGWRGKECTEVCLPWRYGYHCNMPCKCIRKNSKYCHHVTGRCICEAAYEGPTCGKSAASNIIGNVGDIGLKAVYKALCKLCSSNTKNCGSSTKGKCTCKDGYTGTHCTSTCRSFTYGYYCLKKCSCVQANTKSCNPVNGQCTCNSGWGGSICSEKTECAHGHFGENCDLECPCYMNNTQSCDRSNGTCICKPGYQGHNCSSICDRLSYGANCTSICNCSRNAYSNCHHVTGNCTCKPGYIDDGCEKACPIDRFGIGCVGKCQCDTGVCQKETGICLALSSPLALSGGLHDFMNNTEAHLILTGIGTGIVLCIIIVIFWKKAGFSLHEMKARWKNESH